MTDDFKYDDPISGDPEVKVTRQTGLAPAQQVGIDPTPPAEIIQPGDGTEVSRIPFTGAQGFASDGTFHSDRRADDGILFVDHALSDAVGEPPGLARTTAALPNPPGFGDMPATQQREAVKAAAIAAGFVVTDAPTADVPSAVSVVPRDGGSSDPRDMSVGPQVISSLPVVKKRPVVPVVISVPPKAKKVGR